MVLEFRIETLSLEPDVIKVYGVFESDNTADPDLPSVTLLASGPTGKIMTLLLEK